MYIFSFVVFARFSPTMPGLHRSNVLHNHTGSGLHYHLKSSEEIPRAQACGSVRFAILLSDFSYDRCH